MRLLLWILLLAGWSFGSATVLAAQMAPCDVAFLELGPQVSVFEDRDGLLTVDDIARLPAEHFSPMTPQSLPYRFSDSAIWLRLDLVNPGSERCERWLTVGEPRLTNIQVHLLRRDGWEQMHAGVEYPLQEWPVQTRQPMFPLVLAAGEETTLLVRVSSRSLLLVAPLIWSEQGLMAHHLSTSLSDGITFGIVLLVVPFSIALSWVLRSRLLFSHALSVLSYVILVSLVNGYLIHVPALLPWSGELIGVLGVTTYGLFLAYMRVLLRVRSLPPAWARLFNGFFAVLAVCYCWSVLGDYVQGREALELARSLSYVLVLSALLGGVLHGVKYNWLVWLVCGAFAVQGLARLLQLSQLPWQSHQEALSISSTLPGVALLVCTLLMEIGRTRNGEKLALRNLEHQQQAEHERLESTVERRTQQLRESLQARSSLMARISHDLRSPLASIIDYARLLPAVAGNDYPRKIERNARHQLELIDDLLEFSRNELLQLQLSLEPGYLYGFLREIEDEARFLAARGNNVFSCRLDADLPLLVHADFRHLRRVLINLLGNAAKFTRDGQISFQVNCLDREAHAVRLRFEVTDTGIGIAPDEHEQLLEPFRRGRNVEQYDGSGLGLFIVVQLLHSMGAELKLESAAGQGSRVFFDLQLQRAREDELDIALVESHFVALEGVGRRILLVDDIEQNLEWLCDLLDGYGFDVTTAADGLHALECLASERFDLLISDQMMPRMNGWNLLAEVRERWPQLPVLLYSAAPPLRSGHWPRSLAFDASLLKPATSGELLAAIATLLEPGQRNPAPHGRS